MLDVDRGQVEQGLFLQCAERVVREREEGEVGERRAEGIAPSRHVT